MNHETRQRQRAAELAAAQVQCEVHDLNRAAETALEPMSAAITAVGTLDHPELKLRLWALKAEWLRTVRAYTRELERGVEKRQELTRMHGVVRDMHAHSQAERTLPRELRIQRAVKRTLAAHGPLTHLAVATELPDAS